MTRILQGDCRDVLKTLPDESVHCCVTSPPYFGLRDYNVSGQIGLEETPEKYVSELISVFREVRRVLRNDGTLWVNIGDSYSTGKGKTGNSKGRDMGWSNEQSLHRAQNLKPKELIGIPWRVAFALQADGWYLRQDIIWSKPNPMPESVTDRCTKAHEYVFLLSKSARYYFDSKAMKEPAKGWNGSRFEDGKNGKIHPTTGKKRKPAGWNTAKGGHGSFQPDGRAQEVEYTEGICETRNRRSVWTVPTQGFKGAHFATFPAALILPMVLAGCPAGGIVLDPFGGSGTTGEVASGNGRDAVLIELNPDYVKLSHDRNGLFTEDKK